MQKQNIVTIVITKEEILSGNNARVLEALTGLFASKEKAMEWKERIDIAFDGYNDVQWELFEIPEVRSFVEGLDQKFPYWLFFLSKYTLGLQCITYCMLPPFLTEEGRAKVFPKMIASLLTNRWFPAMNQLCEWGGLSDAEIQKMSEQSASYLINGRIK